MPKKKKARKKSNIERMWKCKRRKWRIEEERQRGRMKKNSFKEDEREEKKQGKWE